ncbi:PFGI-1 class ICE element type IV pilus protein PilL2 [Paraburkholderia aspalathi]|nr:PilL N-terminal domain-containing protein [Paraburkholderia aspalathi]
MAWLLAGIVLSSGCATSAALSPPANASTTVALAPAEAVTPIPVVRYGRYALVELGADAAQRYLMQQVIDIALPGTTNATVGDAVRYLLLRSGYQPCAGDGEAGRLYALPLPAADLHLGPMTLHDALRTLAGSAWHVQVDEANRGVCFTPTATTAASTVAPVSPPSGADGTPGAARPMESVPAAEAQP